MNTQIAVVDDHASVRQMLTLALCAEGTYEVVAEAGTGLEAMSLLESARFDIAIVDLNLPELSGVDVVREFRKSPRRIAVIVYTGSTNSELIRAALQERPQGFVHKRESLETLKIAVRTVAAGCCYLSPFGTKMSDPSVGFGRTMAALSTRERSVMQMIAEGRGSKEIAARLAVAPKTVEHYRSAVMRKMGARDIATLTRMAVRGGLVSLE